MVIGGCSSDHPVPTVLRELPVLCGKFVRLIVDHRIVSFLKDKVDDLEYIHLLLSIGRMGDFRRGE